MSGTSIGSRSLDARDRQPPGLAALAQKSRPGAVARLDRAEAWGLLGVLALAGFVRLHALESPSLWSDEAFSWRMAGYGWSEIAARTAADVHPPLYYLLLKAWMRLGGDSVAALRALSGLLGVGTVLGTYLFAVEAFRPADAGTRGGALARARATGLLAAALVALNAFQVVHAREVRMYPLGGLLAVFSTWALLRGIRGAGGALPGIAFVVLASGLAYTHNFGLFTIAAQAAFAVLVGGIEGRPGADRRSRSSGPGRLVLAFALVLLAYGPWLPNLLEQRSRVASSYWTPALDASTIAGAVEQTFTGTVEETPPLAGMTAPLAVGAVLLLLGSRGRGIDLGLIALIALPFLLGLGVSLAQGRNVLVGRFLSFSVPFLMVAIASLVLGGVSGPRMCWVLTGLVLVGPACQLAVTWRNQDAERRPGISAAVGRALADSRPGDLLLSACPGDYLALRYYARRRNVSAFLFRGDSALDSELLWGGPVIGLEERLSGRAIDPARTRRVWLVRSAHGTPVVGALTPRWTVRRSWSFEEAAPYRGGVFLDLLVPERERPADGSRGAAETPGSID